ncbi:DUF3040 domain-containing protein [Streptomyces sp. NPDC047706]|uniref:DUF3040 domain-containing protein n=1 Tax=Streptomyces sp. NPDC047706 TaxID=3365486 RepID=UPI003717675E
MNPEKEIFAQLERRLAQDDPCLAATMEELNAQFPDESRGGPADGHDEAPDAAEKRRDRRTTAAMIFAAIATLGLILTAVFNSSPYQADQDTGPPRGPGAGVSTQSERRFAPENRRGDTAGGDRTNRTTTGSGSRRRVRPCREAAVLVAGRRRQDHRAWPGTGRGRPAGRTGASTVPPPCVPPRPGSLPR